VQSTGKILENYKQQLTVNSYPSEFIHSTDKLLTGKQLTVKQSAEEIKYNLSSLAVPINERYKYTVVGYIQRFGWNKVARWANIAATKNKPEHYFMRILANQNKNG